MALGGARPGAGRKPKAEKYHRDIVGAEKKIRDRLPDIVEAQIKLALGVKAVRENEDGSEEIYLTVPDRQAGQYLMNRIMGTPVQKNENEVSGKDGGPLEIQVYDYNAAIAPITRRPDSDSE